MEKYPVWLLDAYDGGGLEAVNARVNQLQADERDRCLRVLQEAAGPLPRDPAVAELLRRALPRIVSGA
jgi:hypothetical protein